MSVLILNEIIRLRTNERMNERTTTKQNNSTTNNNKVKKKINALSSDRA